MNNRNPSSRPRLYPGLLAGAALAFIGMTLAGIAAPTRTANAQLPDSGAQRNMMIAEMKAMNEKLGEMTKVLKEIRDQEKDKKPATP